MGLGLEGEAVKAGVMSYVYVAAEPSLSFKCSNILQIFSEHSSFCNDRIFSYRVLSCLRLKNAIFNIESLVQQSVNATSSPSVARKQLLLVLNCNSHLSCPFV